MELQYSHITKAKCMPLPSILSVFTVIRSQSFNPTFSPFCLWCSFFLVYIHGYVWSFKIFSVFISMNGNYGFYSASDFSCSTWYFFKKICPWCRIYMSFVASTALCYSITCIRPIQFFFLFLLNTRLLSMTLTLA